MKKQFRTQCRKAAFSLLPAVTAACLSTVTQAQDFVKNFRAQENVKQYSIIPVMNSDEYVMAGTFENKAVHFLHVDGAGNIMASEYYRDNNIHHATNIVALTDNEYIITALRRDASLTTSSRDALELYFVKGDGSLVDQRVIQNTQTINGVNYTNIYPLHSLLYNGFLYVTGFVTNQDVTVPANPNFRGANTKKIFVMRIDPVTLSISASKVYDFVYTPSSYTSSDADMGINLSVTSNGYLYVTGSANVIQPVNSTLYILNAGTLNLQLNATTLNVLNSGNTSFTSDYYPTQFTYGEYGVGMIEDPINGGYYIVSNSADYRKYGLLNIDPQTTFFTHISSSFVPTASPAVTRARVKDPMNAWSLEVMQSASGYDHAMLGGMQTRPLPNCTGNSQDPDINNFNPFLADFTLSWDATNSIISATLNSWKTYRSHFGTGDPSLTNSYYQQGGNFAYNAWNPVFATRRLPVGGTFTDDIAMTAPSWNPNFQALNMKMIRTDAYGDVPSCPDSYTDCNTAGLTYETVNNTSTWGVSPTVVSVAMSTANYPVSVTSVQSALHDYGYLEEIYCDASNNYSYYRKVNPATTAAVTATLTPNPAKDYVQVSIQGIADGNTHVTIEITDITGKTAGILFNGTSDVLGSNSKLKLPALASGLYLVKISAGTQLLPIQKLIITE